MDTPPVRLRLVFDGRRLLRRAQREDGLRRCWLLLRPELATVADLSNHVAARFHLRRSCPHGIVLTMDGFALPPFESTCILRDKDIIRVKQKACKNIVHHNVVHCIQDTEILEKRALPNNDTILAIDYQMDHTKHQEEEVNYKHQPEEYATANCNLESEDASSKRKRRYGDATIPESSKRKKLKGENPEEHIGCSKEDIVHQDLDQYGSKKSSTVGIEAKKVTVQQDETVTFKEQKKARCKKTELNHKKEAADHNTESDKTMNRHARRNKLKRQLRRRRKAEDQLKQNVNSKESPTAVDYPSSSNQNVAPCPSNNQNDLHLPFSSHEADEEEADTSDNIVPVVVRPGHIRFEPAGKSNKSLANEIQAEEIKATLEWSGTVSKKKGQKWGMINSNKKINDTRNYGRIAGSNIEFDYHMLDSKTEKNGICAPGNQNVDETSHDIAEEGKSSNQTLDFENFYPLTRLPKEGDLIVFRLVELSSSWCPEISSYRVGRVLIYDPISLRIILLPVPECPIISEEKEGEHESDMVVDMSPYKEDGSLEIEYSSLLDVRLLEGNESLTAAVNNPIREAGKENGALVKRTVDLHKNKGKIDCQTGPPVPNNTKDPKVAPGKTQDKASAESYEAPNNKPDEVQEKGRGSSKPNASSSAWSYRAQISSALGPTLAYLRGENGKGGNPKPSNPMYG